MSANFMTTGRLFGKVKTTAFLATAASSSTFAADAGAWVAPDRWFSYAIVIVVLAGSVLSLLLIRAALTVSTWSFSDALSEPTELTATEPDAAGIKRIKLDAAGQPLVATEMRASIS